MKPSIPQGTRDFGPETVRKRNYIFNIIRQVFELYGFQPLETPAMENLETLMGKYGEEGDQLIFRIRSNRNLFNTHPEIAKQVKDVLNDIPDFDNTFLPYKSSQALRYDLTIPFARYVAMNYGQLTFPFKRYQMQPVWRGDRPQKGRYREFYQCDADVVGSKSLFSDAEFVNMYADVFEKLGIDVEIKINNRKMLTALAEICQSTDKLANITVAIDKLDKIGVEKVKHELSERGLDQVQIEIIEKYFLIRGSNEEKLSQAKKLFGDNPNGKKAMEELAFVLEQLKSRLADIKIDFTLARGLNYYTGIILEVKAKKAAIGSIGGGGRYDDLTGLFGVPDIPGVGISFGVDRIYDVMEELKLFPDEIYIATKVLFFNLGEKESEKAFGLMHQLRQSNIACELFHENTKFDKQFKYAAKKNIPYVVIIGSVELEQKTCTIKNLKTGLQQTIAQSAIGAFAF